jgi:uncharacterized membrane protein
VKQTPLPLTRERIARLSLKLHVGLFIVVAGGLTKWVMAAPSVARVAGSVLMLIPLVLPAHGVWRRKRRTFAWGTLCLVPYIVAGITEVIASPENRDWATGCLLLSFGAFVAFIAYLRVSSPSDELASTPED